MKRVIATLLLLSAPAQAQVSSTAAPVANSSGSVTNQAVQVVPSRTFGFNYAGISCQGATLHINPFLSTTTSWAHPYESYYQEPVYDTLDLVGATDPEGNPIPMASLTIRAMSYTYVLLEQAKKQITQSTAVLQPQFQYRLTAPTLKAAEKQLKSKWLYSMPSLLTSDLTTKSRDLRTVPH